VQDATRKLQTLYYNNGYIYVNVRPDVLRRIGPTASRSSTFAG